MADDLKTMAAELAADPASLVFLRLGEALRNRGDLDGAALIARTGVEDHPGLAEAHDLYARILVDAGSFEQAEEEWNAVIVLDGRHAGARKGLGFLAYRRGDIDAALDHLELALSVDPTDRSVIEALRTVRNAVEEAPAALAESQPPADVFAGLEGADHGLLLVDARGSVLGGGLRDAAKREVGAAVAAYLAGVSQEAERSARLLELGDWAWIVAEASGANLFLTQPTPGTLLLMERDRSVPSGRLAILAGKATAAARQWLEVQTP